MKCPICGRMFGEDSPEAVLPFCSVRCHQIDCKRWLNEEYSFLQVNEKALEEELDEIERLGAGKGGSPDPEE